MASPSSPGGVTQQLWEDMLSRLRNLSTATVKRNAELEARLAETEVELSVWKQAHATALEIAERAERDKRIHQRQVLTLNRQIASLETLNDQNPLILCVIDGNSYIPTQSLLSQGQNGGRQAAQMLTKGVAEFLSKEEVPTGSRLSFWVTVYLNKRGLLETLLGNDACTVEQFDAFYMGFSQASPRFQVIDVGYGSDVVGTKIDEYLQTYSRFSQTLRIFLGGAHDNTYLPTLIGLDNEQLLGKLVLLQSYRETSPEIYNLYLPTLMMGDLFLPQKLPHVRKPGSLPLDGLGTITTNGGLMSPKSPLTSSSRSTVRLIDQSKPLHKQTPPPCNEHYLMTCSKGPACKYSHEYYLTPEQLSTLAKNAKKAPCNYLKNGLTCPHGDNCCWGHVCPNGKSCFHLSKGKCWFKGDGMHPTD